MSYLGASFTLLSLLSQPESADLSFEKLIENYEASISVHERAFAADELLVTSSEGAFDFEGEPRMREVRARLYRRGGDFDVTLVDHKYYLLNAADEESGFSTQSDNLRVISLESGSEHGYKFYSHQKGPQPGSDFVSVSRDYELTKTAAFFALGPSAVLDGYLMGDTGTSIPSIFRSENSTVHVAFGELNSIPVYRVEAQSEYGDYTIWLDPDRGFNPRRIEIRKHGSDLFNGETLDRELPALPEGAIPKEPWSRKTKYEFTVDKIEFVEVDGQWVIASANIEETTFFESDESTSRKTEYSRSNISLNPNFAAEGAFNLDAPDGARAALIGSSFRISQYRWVGGKLIPVVDIGEIEEIMFDIEALEEEFPTISRTTDTPERNDTEGSRAEVTEAKSRFSAVYAVAIAVLLVCGVAAVFIRHRGKA